MVSLDMMVLMMFTFNASSREIPAPSQPGHVVDDDVVSDVRRVPADGRPGGAGHDVRPVHVLEAEAAAAAALRRVAHDEVGIDGQAPDRCHHRSGAIVFGGRPQSRSPCRSGSRRRARMRIPPPLVGIVGLVLWLKMTVLCSMSPL